jgi:hypothetical protein
MARHDSRSKLLTAEEFRVTIREIGPFLRQIVKRKYCRNRAYWNASSAIDAFDRIDIQQLFAFELFRVFFRMDAVHRACVHTCSVFGPDTGFSYNVSHATSLEFTFR